MIDPTVHPGFLGCTAGHAWRQRAQQQHTSAAAASSGWRPDSRARSQQFHRGYKRVSGALKLKGPPAGILAMASRAAPPDWGKLMKGKILLQERIQGDGCATSQAVGGLSDTLTALALARCLLCSMGRCYHLVLLRHAGWSRPAARRRSRVRLGAWRCSGCLPSHVYRWRGRRPLSARRLLVLTA